MHHGCGCAPSSPSSYGKRHRMLTERGSGTGKSLLFFLVHFGQSLQRRALVNPVWLLESTLGTWRYIDTSESHVTTMLLSKKMYRQPQAN